MKKFNDALLALAGDVRLYIVGLIALAFVVIGVMMIYPHERSKETAKSMLPWVIIGTAIALAAVEVAKWLTTTL